MSVTVMLELRFKPESVAEAREVCAHNNWKPAEFSADAIEALQSYAWPGNVRELRNAIERVILLTSNGSQPLTISAVNITGANAAAFTRFTTCVTTLAIGIGVTRAKQRGKSRAS